MRQIVRGPGKVNHRVHYSESKWLLDAMLDTNRMMTLYLNGMDALSRTGDATADSQIFKFSRKRD